MPGFYNQVEFKKQRITCQELVSTGVTYVGMPAQLPHMLQSGSIQKIVVLGYKTEHNTYKNKWLN